MRPRALALALLLATLAPACNQNEGPQEGAPPGARTVHFESADGVRLEGKLFGREGSETGVVLSHMFPADQSSWFDFAGTLADRGYLALAYDFRGYCPGGEAGCSQGSKDFASLPQDVLGAISFIRDQGVGKVALIGASMGGTASIVAASQDRSDVDAVITLSAPPAFEGMSAGRSELQRVFAPKLFIAAVGDASAAQSAQAFYDQSPQPKRLEILPADDHGTDLLSGNQAGRVQTLILDYLAQFGGEEA